MLVRRVEAEQRSPGGILIPDNIKEKPQQGEVIAVGPGARDESGRLIPVSVKAGDRVLFAKWSGSEVRIGSDDCLVMKEADILGVVEDRPRLAAA